ncbi:MalY/PatB family protein [Arachnia rubra]|uniref:cysteine-S-conjugate beta-lyase n=1 Tax=Arachnia rubra TaxID=1547448 RepID=A0ABX7Y3Z0_9ACTN|nr:aminotransferase class I/II-fold pyridoxal phosphate-dependent enzyme [Arachnia rubra]MBB1577603.1 aminotransferase class I/II-fold pyridoxal phosphate-dependent enzyme [Propionibacterium sp.]MDO4646780.1 aminotransferase class I/II-fold pyridoxal phosphate-dependent enzyme [Propionibacteriaceae bacterium]QUC07914.1 aminotransferase class I/II-fold pyridoxal phosphate-dependent enzyme [Arachnia rubra]BCR82260.1 cystathionine beta-lyase [Arachnia rubra]
MTVFDVPLEELRRRRSIKWARFGPDVLPMFVAEMDARPVPAVVEVLSRMVADGDTGYPELPDYQEAFAGFARDVWSWQIDPAEILLAGDVMSGMRELTLATTQPGDAVVINPPVYPPFRAVCRTTGRRIVEVPVTADGRLDLDALAEAFKREHPAAYLLCSPHNPSGVVHTADELARVMELANAHDVTVICDEIHAPLSGAEHTPIQLVPGGERALTVTSASKSWNLAGLKAGLIVPGAEAAGLVRSLGGYVPESASYLGVVAHATALTHGRDWLAEAVAGIHENKQYFADELHRAIPELSWTPSQGTYLAWVDCSPLGLTHAGQHFFEQAKVRFGQGTDYDPAATQFVRVNLATSQEIISEAVRRMAASL